MSWNFDETDFGNTVVIYNKHIDKVHKHKKINKLSELSFL